MNVPYSWNDWNYKVGHDELIEDKYNSSIIAFMSPLMRVHEYDIKMIYSPDYNTNVTKGDNCYKIKSGTYNIPSCIVKYISSN